MRDRDLYARILGIEFPWKVVEVELDTAGGRVEVHIEHGGETLCCPECGAVAPGYDVRERRWRHLDTCQYQTLLVAKVPRAECDEDGVRQIRVPWSEPGSRFTALFEALVIDWLQETSMSAVARQLGLTWGQVDGVMQRAVRRGLGRREAQLPEHIGVDETSFQKRHEYVTIVHDAKTGSVVHVGDSRKKEVLTEFYGQFSDQERTGVQSVAMDMWGPYIEATKEAIPGAEKKTAFDKFHIAKHLGDGVDKVRRQEHRELRREGGRTEFCCAVDEVHRSRLPESREVSRGDLLSSRRSRSLSDRCHPVMSYPPESRKSRYYYGFVPLHLVPDSVDFLGHECVFTTPCGDDGNVR